MNKRLQQFIDYKNISIREFSTKISDNGGKVYKFLSGNNVSKIDFLVKINESFPELNIDWLVTGRGEMIYQQQQVEQTDDEEKLNELEGRVERLKQEFNSLKQQQNFIQELLVASVSGKKEGVLLQ